MVEIPFQNSLTIDQILKCGVYIGEFRGIKEIYNGKGPMMMFKFYIHGSEQEVNGFCIVDIEKPSYKLRKWLSILSDGDIDFTIDFTQKLDFNSFRDKYVKLYIGRYTKNGSERNVVNDLIGLADESEMDMLNCELRRQYEEHIQKYQPPIK